MDKIKSILKFGMRMEKDAADFYEFYMDKAESEETRELFSELATIEKQHYKILNKKFEEYQYTEPPQAMSWVVDDSSRAQDPHILADNSDTIPAAAGAATDLSIFRMAYLIEHDFAYFYSRAAEAVEEPGVRKFLQDMAEWEKQHSDIFQKKYQNLLKKSWGDIAGLML